MEKKLERLKKGGDPGELGDMLHEYGKLVGRVEGEMEAERAKQAAALDDKLSKRREQKRLEALAKRKEREEKES